MSLVEVAKQGPGTIEKGPTCTACQLVASLPDSEAGALRQMLADPMWRYSAISTALQNEGHLIAEQTLARHARGLCSARTKLR